MGTSKNQKWATYGITAVLIAFGLVLLGGCTTLAILFPKPAPTVLTNKETKETVTINADGYFELSGVSRYYPTITSEQENAFSAEWLLDENGRSAVISTNSMYREYLAFQDFCNKYERKWGFDVAKRQGSAFVTRLEIAGVPYTGVHVYLPKWGPRRSPPQYCIVPRHEED